MPKTLKEVEEEVVKSCGAEAVDDFIEFLSHKPILFWGRQQLDGFLTDMVVLALYKRINGGGYQRY